MSLPPVYSRAEVSALFGFSRWPLTDGELRPVSIERRPPGRPTDYYSASAVYSLHRKLFGRLPSPDEIEQALASVQRNRLTKLLSHIHRKIRTLGAQPNA